jgi:hypothetical protein
MSLLDDPVQSTLHYSVEDRKQFFGDPDPVLISDPACLSPKLKIKKIL